MGILNKLKKPIAVLVAAMTCVTMMPATVFSEEIPEQAEEILESQEPVVETFRVDTSVGEGGSISLTDEYGNLVLDENYQEAKAVFLAEGDTACFVVSAWDGYQETEVIAESAYGEYLPVQGSIGSVQSFRMPGCPVTIYAGFEPVVEETEEVIEEEIITPETELEQEMQEEIIPEAENTPDPEPEEDIGVPEIPEEVIPEETEHTEDVETVPEETPEILPVSEAPEEIVEPASKEEASLEKEDDAKKEIKETPSKENKETKDSEEEAKEDLYAVEGFPYATLNRLNFSSMRILVGTEDPSIFVDESVVISGYKGVYILQFEDAETVQKAYAYYLDKADFVEVDTGIMISEGEAGEIVNVESSMSEEENPLSELQNAIAETGRGSFDIALIDTGAEGADQAVSMIGDYTGDDNGHGTQMLGYIREQNPQAKVLSIKALGSDGVGSISEVYAAIQYALTQNVKIINLSVSAIASSDSSVIEEAVNEARNRGILVVGSAGNNGKNAKYYVPGGIASAIIIGAADETGARYEQSNYGDTVDYNVVAESTSEAAAKFSGFVSANGIGKVEEVLNKGFIFETDFTGNVAAFRDLGTFYRLADGFIIAANGWSTGYENEQFFYIKDGSTTQQAFCADWGLFSPNPDSPNLAPYIDSSGTVPNFEDITSDITLKKRAMMGWLMQNGTISGENAATFITQIAVWMITFDSSYGDFWTTRTTAYGTLSMSVAQFIEAVGLNLSSVKKQAQSLYDQADEATSTAKARNKWAEGVIWWRNKTLRNKDWSTYTKVQDLVTYNPKFFGWATLKKSSPVSGADLKGALYKVVDDEGTTVGFFVTQTNGTGYVAEKSKTEPASGLYTKYGSNFYIATSTSSSGQKMKLPPGEYTLSEVKAPDNGQFKKSTETWTFTIKADKTTALAYTPGQSETELLNEEPVESFLTLKKSADTDGSLKGALYAIYNSAGKTAGYFVTNASGTGYVAEKTQDTPASSKLYAEYKGNYYVSTGSTKMELKSGSYTVKEITPPANGLFEKSTKTYSFTLAIGDTYALKYTRGDTNSDVFYDIGIQPSYLQFKKQRATGATSTASLAGALYGVYTSASTSDRIGYFLTNSSGTGFVAKRYAAKNYTVTYTEQAIDDYPTGRLYRGVTLTDDDGDSDTYEWGIKSGSYWYVKTNEQKLLVDPGTYYVSERIAPATGAYALDQTFRGGFTVAQGGTITITDADTDALGKIRVQKSLAKPLAANISLQKTGTLTSLTQGNRCYSLQGAVYGIYSDSACTKLVGTMTTNASGIATYSNLALQTYYVKEITPSKGYLKNEEVVTYHLETLKANYNLEATYEIRKGSTTVCTLKCDPTTGLSPVSPDLPVGKYTVVETINGKGLKINTGSTTITIEEGKTIVLSTGVAVDDYNVTTVSGNTTEEPGNDPSYLTVEKRDARTGESRDALDGTVFTLKYYDNTDGNTSETPLRTWKIATETKEGITGFILNGRDEFWLGSLVAGSSALYRNDMGAIVWPVGTYQLTETTPASGYTTEGAEWTDAEGQPISLNPSTGGYVFKVEVVDGTISGGTRISGKASLIVKNISIKKGFRFYKVDQNTGLATPQGDGALTGGEYAVINRSNGKVEVEDVSYNPGETVFTFTMPDATEYRSPEELLPVGEYELIETDSPVGYKNSGIISARFTIDETSTEEFVDLTATIKNEVIKGGVSVIKNDAESNESFSQGDGSLEGITFTITNKSENAITIDNDINVEGKVSIKKGSYASGAEVGTITSFWDETEKKHIATTDADMDGADNTLPYGTYEIKETSTNDSYLLTDGTVYTFEIRKDGEVVSKNKGGSDLIFSNQIKRGGVRIQKVLKELGTANIEGLASLEDNTIAIINASTEDVFVKNAWYGSIEDKGQEGSLTTSSFQLNNTGYSRAELIAAIEAAKEAGNNPEVMVLKTNSNGEAQTGERDLPYGTYYLYEKKSNASLMTDMDWVLRVEIREDGRIVDASSAPVQDDIVRGGIFFEKTNGSGYGKPNIPFLLVAYNENGAPIEGHVIVTGAQGYTSTSKIYTENGSGSIVETDRDNTYRTNGLDAYVVYDAATGAYKVTEEGEALLANGEAAKFGVWFSRALNIDGSLATGKASPEKGKGSLYYGNYKLFEISCKDNRENGENLLYSHDYILVRDKIAEEDVSGNIVSEKAGADVRSSRRFQDKKVPLESDALDVVSSQGSRKSKVTFVKDNVELSDTISYNELETTSVYKWIVEFVETGNPTNVLSKVIVDRYRPTAADSSDSYVAKGSFTVTTKGTISGNYTGTPSVTATGNIDTRAYAGKSISVVVRLYQYTTGYDFTKEPELLETINPITGHNEDTTDTAQIVYIPAMSTSAADKLTRDHVGTGVGETAVIDTVTLQNIGTMEYYVLEETFMDKDTGRVFEKASKTVKTIYSGRSDIDHIATQEVSMPEVLIKTEELGTTKALVVYEQLWRTDEQGNKLDAYPVVTHESLVDEEQSIYYPSVSTTAADSITSDHVGTVDENAVLYDEVKAKNLIAGQEYKLGGDVHYKEDVLNEEGAIVHQAGDIVESATLVKAFMEGNEIPVEEGKAVFTVPEGGTKTKDITVLLQYELNSLEMEGYSAVVFEDLYHNDVVVASHADLEDENQTVHYPKIRTTAKDGDTGDEVGSVNKAAVIIDTVEMWNLIPGQTYRVEGRLMDQESGRAFSQSGIVMKGETFIAERANETHTVTFTGIDSTKLEDKSLVVFEKLFHPEENDGVEKEVANHEDITDKGQTIHYPKVKTTAVDSRTKDHIGSIYGENINEARNFFGLDTEEDSMQTITDRVLLYNLVPGRKYTVSGTLMNKETGEAVLIDNKEITQTAVVSVGVGTITAEGKQPCGVSSWDREHNRISGYVELAFTFDSSKLVRHGEENTEGLVTVAFETLQHNDIEVAVHKDFNDEEQSVYEPSIRTTAIDSRTANHVGDSPRKSSTDSHIKDENETSLVDTVLLKGLKAGEEYTVGGYLAVKELSNEGKAVFLAKDGDFTTDKAKALYEEVTFTADENTQSVEMTFLINKESVAGKSLVAFEQLIYKEEIITIHADINDEGQTVHFPDVQTSLKDARTEDHVGTAQKDITLIDSVSYTNLLPEERYTISGRLAYQQDGTDALGNIHKAGEFVKDPVTGQAYFASVILEAGEHEADGSADLTFTVDGRVLAGLTVVAEEMLLHNGIVVGAHADIRDQSQSVHFPKLRTTAIDKQTGDHNGVTRGENMNPVRQMLGENPEETATVVDTVELINLIPGMQYTVSGVLMDKRTKEPVVMDGEAVTAEAVITVGAGTLNAEDGEKTTVSAYDAEYQSLSGTVDLEFSLDTSVLAKYGEEEQESFIVVVYETLLHNGVEVAEHKDINDEGQSVYGPQIRTNAADSKTESHVGDSPRAEETDESINDDPSTKVIDTVTYEGLIVGDEYTISGVLAVREESSEESVSYLKEDGTLTKDKKEAMTVSTTFVAEESDGFVDIVFDVTSSALAGKTVVAFEDLVHNGITLTTHANLQDEQQSVHYPKIKTSLRAGGTGYEESFFNRETIVLVDTVTYENLIPGHPYTLNGVLMAKETRSPFMANEEEVRATARFVPAEPNGTIEIAFTFDGRAYEGETLVAFEELLSAKGEDSSESAIYYECECGKLFEGLDAWNEHLHSLETACHCGEYFETKEELDAHLALHAEEEGHYEESADHDSWIQTEQTDSTDLITVATHADLNDIEQTVGLPEIRTTLTDVNGEKMVLASENMVLKDTVRYRSLTAGHTYTVRGRLMDKETGLAARDDKGHMITAESTFTAQGREGEVEITFTFSGKNLEGKSLVAFESVYYENELVGEHKDIQDEDQTVRVPKARTSAKAENGTKMANSAKNHTITDTITYSNLIPGLTYEATGLLVNPAVYKAGSEEGVLAKGSKTFIPEQADGAVEVPFEIAANLFTGKAVVLEYVFLKTSSQTIQVAEHAEPLDEAQTIRFPEARTTAVFSSGLKIADRHEETTIIDTVTYRNLQKGQSYVVRGTLMDQASKKAVLINEKELTAETSFVAQAESGTVELTFRVPKDLVTGKQVVFETIYVKTGTELIDVAEHKDFEDEAQTVIYPQVGTTAMFSNGTKMAEKKATVAIVDTVSYTGLIKGLQYKISGVLMDLTTKKAVTVNGKEVVAEKVFTAKEMQGEEKLEFRVPETVPAGAYVVFETLTTKDKTGKEVTVASHKDPSDKEQTVYYPEVGTKATFAGGAKSASSGEAQTITDTITYKNLQTGTYIVKGTLMSKATGQAITINNQPVTAKGTLTVTEGKENGSMQMPFAIPAGTVKGDTVVFEEVFLQKDGKEILVASHKEISDADQTVTFTTPPPVSPPPTVKTGDESRGLLWMFLGLGALAMMTGMGLYLRKKQGQK